MRNYNCLLVYYVAEGKSKVFPILHRGVVQKVDPALLEEGQFENLQNMTSIQEGALSVRLGSRKYANAATVGVVHSMAKLTLGSDVSDPRYLGDGAALRRVTGPYTTFADVIPGGLVVNSSQWESVPFDSEGSGKPVMYFAHQSRMFRDNGAFATLRPWGIRPPPRPVIAVAADPTYSSGFVLLTDQSSGGTARLAGPTVVSVETLAANYYRVTLTSTEDILVGTYVTFSGAGGSMLVDSMGTNIIIGRASASPTGTVTAFYRAVILPSTPTIADGTAWYQDNTATVDWSLNGLEKDGYDHNDLVHVGLYLDGIENIQEIRIRVFVNSSATDYYEKAIAPSQAQGFASGTSTAQLTVEEIQAQFNAGLITFERAQELIAELLQQLQSSPIPPTIGPTWYEFDISKLDFLKVGNAGSGAKTWKNVTKVQVYVISKNTSGNPAFVVRVGAIYAVGGQGPDSDEPDISNPYDWLYTLRNPATGAEGNPCVPMIQERWLTLKNRAAQLTISGADTDATTGDPSLAGFGSIAIYRRGGRFADGLYRFIGYSTNPGFSGGVPQTVTFVDNNTDQQIIGNRTIEFDNDPPITSRPQVPFAATISAISPSVVADQLATLTLTGFSGGGLLSTFMSVGSTVHVGQGSDAAEDCIVHSINDGGVTITVWVQRSHAVGDQVSCEAILGATCDVVCQAGSRIFLAGDANNPNTVYMSKSGRPHAFPFKNLTSGAVHQLIVGSPDNPVNGLAEYNGEYICLNKNRIYVFSVLNGQMTQPIEMPATRGLFIKHAWCKFGQQIWYLAYDGIYSWAGGTSTKMTKALDWIFRGKVVGAFQPVDLSQATFIQIFGFSEHVYFLYRDALNNNRAIRYSVAEDRWEPVLYSTAADIGSITRVLVEEDTGRVVGARFSNAASKTFLTQLETGTSDSYTTLVNDGAKIDFLAKSASFSPEGRLNQIHAQEVVIELLNPGDAVTVKLFYDFSATADATDTFTIPVGATRRRVPLPLQVSGGDSYGKECNSFALEFSGSTNAELTIYSVGLQWAPLGEIQRGKVSDWADLGHPFDKRLYEVTIEFNTHGSAVTLKLDTLSGLSGILKTEGVQSFTLDGVLNRGKKTFSINDGVIATQVRLRPTVTSVDFEIFSVQWVKEDYPPPVTRFTEYTDDGNPYDKYFQQLVLDVNTNNQIVPVTIEADGASAQTVNVQSTLATRNQIKTLNPAILAKKARILVGTIPSGGQFQLFSHKFITQPGDKGPVAHTTDWDELGHPFDKRLRTLTVSYDNASQGPITLQVDTLTGIAGGTPNITAMSFTLSATGRGQQTFAIPDGQIVKSVRLHPSADNVSFKMWSYLFDFEKYPADSVAWTEWNDFGYEHDKIIQELAFDVDTGGVAASVIIQADGGGLQTISVNTTGSTREFIYTLNPELVGKKFRLLITPGGGGKFQLWKWMPKFIKGDPGPVEHSFDYDDLGSPFDKRLLTVTFEYDKGVTALTMVMDTVSGVNGDVDALAVQSFVLTGTGRSKQTFSIALDTIVKMVRIRPLSTFSTLKIWKYVFTKVDLPPDTVAATPWDEMGYSCGKALRSFTVDIDTGGVAGALQLQVDGVNVGSPYSVTTTATDRVRILTAPADTLGKMFRIVLTPGTGGKAQVYEVKFDAIREPCCVTRIDTFEISLGAAGYKFVKQIWLQYKCAVAVYFYLYGDTGRLLHYEELPAHTGRTVERFYLYDVYDGVANRNKQHRVVIVPSDGTTCIQLWGDQSRIESLNLSGDQRAAYEQHYLSMLTAPQGNVPNT